MKQEGGKYILDIGTENLSVTIQFNCFQEQKSMLLSGYFFLILLLFFNPGYLC